MTATVQRAPRVHLPDLGPRGEGWVALQAVLFVIVIAERDADPVRGRVLVNRPGGGEAEWA